MYNRILSFPFDQKSSAFLFGPRGTGKTSWIKANMPTAVYFDLLDFATFSALSANPSRLESLIPPNTKEWVVIDEIQCVPELLNQVHRLIESQKIRFLLTGSSARTLRKKGVNLLAGRALQYHMHPLVIQELGSDFNLDHALRYGLLPMVITHENPAKYLESYVQTYLREEVLQEGLTRNIGTFTRFLEIASFSQGAVLNFSEIARELGLNRLMVAQYFDILEDLLLSIRIPVFAKRAKRKVIAHQKFYFFDAGVFRYIRPTGPLDSREEIDGSVLETLFLQSLRAINDYNNFGYTISFWRTVAGNEVDFVLYGPRGFHAFEIKRSATITPKTLSGLKNFSDDYPEAKLYVIFLGGHKEYYGNITALPLQLALQELPAILG